MIGRGAVTQPGAPQPRPRIQAPAARDTHPGIATERADRAA